jgi:hypothetical protein
VPPERPCAAGARLCPVRLYMVMNLAALTTCGRGRSGAQGTASGAGAGGPTRGRLRTPGCLALTTSFVWITSKASGTILLWARFQAWLPTLGQP